MDIFFVVLREPPSGMGTQDEVPSRRVRRLHPHRIRLTANRIRPFLDRFSTITVESSTSKVQITSAKTLNNKGGLARQVRMLRKPFISTRQPSPTDSVQDGWLSHIRTPFSPKAGREHGHPCRWTPVRPHAFTGMVRSDWFMVGTRDVVTACRNVLSRSRRVLSCS